MNNRFRVILTVCFNALLLCAAPNVHAQQPSGPPRGGGGPPSAAQELQQLSASLGLSDEQKAAILPILEKRHTDIEALIHSSTDRTATGQQIHSTIETSDAQIRAVLTEQQLAKFNEMRPAGPPQSGDSQGQDMGNGPPPNGGQPPQ